jgi:Photosynthesis system II assembly factor YCF48
VSEAVKTLTVFFILSLGLPLYGQAAQRWKIRYSYKKLDSLLELRDIKCPSAQRCIAAGVVFEKNGREQGLVVLTSDGGKQWSVVDVKEHPVSLFFLNDSVGWMVTDRGIWSTAESGRSWTKVETPKGGILRVHFLDPSHGYATGLPKLVYETTDGGKKWNKLAAAEQPPTDAQDTVYDCIAFSGEHGVIVGNLIQRENVGRPIWLDPDVARYRREHETKVAILETFDGGKKWAASTLPIVGTLSQLKFANDGSAIMLVEYMNYFSLPSSVYKTRLRQAGALTIFEERDRAVTDVSLLPDGSAILASIEPPGSSNQVPIPGKVKMYESADLKVWREMDIDYRAVAQRAMLAAIDPQHIWMATDTGMILSLADARTTNP